MPASPSVIWFYRDLRLQDHAALTQAAARGPIIPLYIHDAAHKEGGASKWWLHASLRDFAAQLQKHNLPLILRQGEPLEILRDLIKQSGAKSVCWSRRYAPELAARDEKIVHALRKDGIAVSIHTGFLLFEPERIKNQSGSVFKVYTPFSKACFSAPDPGLPLPAPKNMQGVSGLNSDALDSFRLVPPKAEWPKTLAAAWRVGEDAAHHMLHDFIEKELAAYKDMRNRPDVKGTSRLSPYLHFGQISPRRIWRAVQRHRDQAGAETYLNEILWREFSWHLLHHMPDMVTAPLQKSFNNFPWRQDDKGLQAWQRGQTGYPIVDAGMRELWQTGWMHNRVRMITASFLIKDLLIDWRAGMDWFWDTLVDADLGANTASWQWVAGCGADAAPYFRIFNPVLQGLKFDPKGDYVRRFVPELAHLDNEFIHEPWKAPASVLAKAGITLGKTYPYPIIDHGKARDRALHALKISKGEVEAMEGSMDLFG